MLRQALEKDEMKDMTKHAFIQIVLMLIFVAGAIACIGNPNGVSLTLPPESFDSEKASSFCESAPACTQKNNSILYVTEEGLAVTVGEKEENDYYPSIDIEIPVDENGNATFNYTDWSEAYKRELSSLSRADVINITSESIDGITNSSRFKGGAILSYFGDVRSTNASVAQANTLVADTYRESGNGGGAGAGGMTSPTKPSMEYCSGPAITTNDLPKTKSVETPPASPLPLLPWLGIGQPAAAHEATDTGTEGELPPKVTPPSPKATPMSFYLLNYWWVILLVLALAFLVFKLQIGGREELMTPEDMSVLAAPRRIEMMKSLTERKKTLTELSKEENISLPTAKEHLEKLEKSGMVKKHDTGRKWKYYELTRKGNRILNSTDFENN